MSGARLVVPRRFRGPATSGNGGWVSGRLAAVLSRGVGGPAVTVTLRAPPPLEAPLTVVADGAAARLETADGRLVAEAAREPLDVDAVPAVDAVAAAAAEASYAGLAVHPFPECFACGTSRQPGDGLCLRPGRLRDGTARTACTWVPHPSVAVAGAVPAEVVWAALDCPGGWTADLEGRPMVLGRMAAGLASLPALGERCVVMGALLGAEGRKTWTATTAYGADGRELGRAAATWITIR